MKPSNICLVILYFVQTYAQDSDTDNDVLSSVDCSQFSNDYAVLASLPFSTPINPPSPSLSTYALAYNNGTVYSIHIAYETYIPSTIFCLQSVKDFVVGNSKFCTDEIQNDSSICKLPSEISRLADSLETLSIYSTPITHLPASFGKLKRLIKLSLSNTSLMDLPNTFGNLRSLSSLSISYNKLKSLPKVIGMINSLTEIVLYQNIELHSIQSLNGHQNLSRLSIYNCPITRIPLNLPNICLLYMSNNSLTNLNGIETLGTGGSCYQSFAFPYNQIRTIPNQISLIKKFAALQINNNTLSNIPSNMYNIETMSYLDIRNNTFKVNRLKEIVEKFKITNPSLLLVY